MAERTKGGLIPSPKNESKLVALRHYSGGDASKLARAKRELVMQETIVSGTGRRATPGLGITRLKKIGSAELARCVGF